VCRVTVNTVARLEAHSTALSPDALSALGRCYYGQLSVSIAVTSYIDRVGGSFNDGIT
jgi:hypothetical protein